VNIVLVAAEAIEHARVLDFDEIAVFLADLA
jgi:hypothetical protein